MGNGWCLLSLRRPPKAVRDNEYTGRQSQRAWSRPGPARPHHRRPERIIPIPGADEIKWSGELARKEGIFVGITAGATFAGSLQVAAEAPKGSTILAMLPDTGERYLSTPLFANIPAEMTEEESKISRSTPSHQFSAQA